MKTIICLLALSLSLSAMALDPAKCPSAIDLDIDSVQARVHTGFTGDADYRAGVEALNRLGAAQITYELIERKLDSCEYSARSNGALNGKATIYTKSNFHPDENRWIPSNYLRTRFWVPGIRASFALFIPVEFSEDAFQAIEGSERRRTLMALLTDGNGRTNYRRSGTVTFSVAGRF